MQLVPLHIGPFNYPFLLTGGVVAGAIAAGNNVILKPSLDVPASTRLLAGLVLPGVRLVMWRSTISTACV
jgi:acyl-CoA reductase-like NAD-dependent aldehyde dehydrogenase